MNENVEVKVSVDANRGTGSAETLLPASPERVFRALTSSEICNWWVRPGVFDTRQWKGDVRVDGNWSASGLAGGRPYRLEGRYLAVDPCHALSFTWSNPDVSPAETTVAFDLVGSGSGTLLRVTHSGMTSPQACAANSEGWKTSLEELNIILAKERAET